jgi:branched-chain amino acid aminotransferase
MTPPGAQAPTSGAQTSLQAKAVWHNGKLVPFAEALIHVSSFGLHYGLGVFEGVRAYRRHDGRTAIFRLDEHVTRLYQSAAACEMDVPFTSAVVKQACIDTLRANDLSEGYLRPLVYTGAGALGMGARNNPIEVAVLAWPWSGVLGAQAADQGVRAHISSLIRAHVNSVMSKAKIVGQYTASVLVKRESQRLGLDEAIMLDAEGRVTESSAQNVFAVWEDGGKAQLFTPPLELSILAGITRASVIALARDLGVPVVERSFTRDMLYTASEIFLTGTATEITPVRELDGRPIGGGQPGPVTRKIQQAFFAVARGPGDAHPEWLTQL